MNLNLNSAVNSNSRSQNLNFEFVRVLSEYSTPVAVVYSLFKFTVTIQIRIMNSARERLNHFTIQGTGPLQVWLDVAFTREYFMDAG